MDRFKFRLEKVKSHRERLKKEAERFFSQKLAALNMAENTMAQLIEEKDRDKAEGANILTAAELFLMGEYEGFLQNLIMKQKVVIQEAEKAVELAREELIEKAKEEKALSLLKDKQQEDYLQDRRRREKKSTSEIAIRQFQRKD